MDKILNEVKDIRMAGTLEKDKIFIYVPVNTTVKVDLDLSDYNIKIMDSEDKNICIPNYEVVDGKTTNHMHNFEQDGLIILEKEI